MTRWLSAFLFTQIVEVPLYTAALRGRPLVAFGASAITHPVVWFVFPKLFPGQYLLGVVFAEIFAVLVEGVYMARFGLKRSYLVSLGVNATSLGLGLTCRHFFGWP